MARWEEIQIHIKIGEVQTLTVENWQFVPDDRQTQIQTIGGVIVQDFGHVEEGDKFTCTITTRKEDSEIIFGYWHSRTLITVEDEGGNIFENMRVVIKNYSYLTGFKKYFKASVEFWKV